jgi:hypothetical protein
MSVRLPTRGIDYAWGSPAFDALRGQGVRFVMRYLSHDPSKDLDAGELRELHRRSIAAGVVWETTAGRTLQGYDAGRADAIAADQRVRALGLAGIPIYFAVDVDVAGVSVAPYFRGAASVIGRRRNGAYGSYRVVSWLRGQGITRWSWQTYAWSGGAIYPGVDVYQYQNGVHVAGVACDLDRARSLAPMRGPQATKAQRRRARRRQALALLRKAAHYHTGPNIRRAIRYLKRHPGGDHA